MRTPPIRFPVRISSLAMPAMAAVLALGPADASARAQTSVNMTELARFYPPNTVKGASGIWGHTDANGREYALLTTREPGGLHIIDITEPAAPRDVKFIPSSGNSLWHEVNGFGKTAYKVSQQNQDGLQIIDLSPLDRGEEPVLVKSTTEWFQVAHTLFVDTTTSPARLFVNYGSASGVKIFTLADPHNPVLVRTIEGETHDMFARRDRLYVSTQYGATLVIYSLEDLEHTPPLKIGVIDFNQVSPANGEPAKSIAHNAWPSEDDRYLFTTEEIEGTTLKAFDITDFSLASPPRLVGTYVAAKGIIAHNAYVKGNYLYVAHYTAGLRVVDISDPARMTEVAFHMPSTSTEKYGGTWGAYPWFKSGSIIHGDDIQGLFVVKLDVLQSDVKGKAGRRPFSITPLPGNRMDLYFPRGGPFVLSVHAISGRELFRLPGRAEAGLRTLVLDDGALARGRCIATLRQGGQSASAPFDNR